ncbi:hypothetical protein BJ508DRAFT_312368 [Ascobolus immersus RN42]|uniref:Uncharacterized protein n=1 Tax=Ascobolus immersus RN42 TaxID=1160509 RepID=A0A3N4HMF5_ASCIM|nr:hypothetical protein BJ508DRAFT_312368 [Ascobolus immersus RN42]
MTTDHEEPKVEGTKVNSEEPKVEETKVDSQETKVEEPVEEPKTDEPKVEEPKVEWAEEVEAVEAATAAVAEKTTEPVETVEAAEPTAAAEDKTAEEKSSGTTTPEEDDAEKGWTVVKRKVRPVKPDNGKGIKYNSNNKTTNGDRKENANRNGKSNATGNGNVTGAGKGKAAFQPKPEFEPLPPPRFDRRTAGSRLARLGWKKLEDENRAALRTQLKDGYKLHAQRGVWKLERDFLLMVESAERDNYGKMYITDTEFSFVFLFAKDLCDAVDRLVEDNKKEGSKLVRSGPVRGWGGKYLENAADELSKFENLQQWVGDIIANA